MKAGWGESSSPCLSFCLLGSGTRASCQQLPRFLGRYREVPRQGGRMPVLKVREGRQATPILTFENSWRRASFRYSMSVPTYCIGCCFNSPSEPCSVLPSLCSCHTAPPTGHWFSRVAGGSERTSSSCGASIFPIWAKLDLANSPAASRSPHSFSLSVPRSPSFDGT